MINSEGHSCGLQNIPHPRSSVSFDQNRPNFLYLAASSCIQHQKPAVLGRQGILIWNKETGFLTLSYTKPTWGIRELTQQSIFGGGSYTKTFPKTNVNYLFFRFYFLLAVCQVYILNFYMYVFIYLFPNSVPFPPLLWAPPLSLPPPTPWTLTFLFRKWQASHGYQ